MARALRLEYPGAWWHVYNRGVERRDICLDDIDRNNLLNAIGGSSQRFRWRVHAYVLMTNHYHLLIETTEPTLSRGVKAFAGHYAIAFNKRHSRVGPLFQGRFKAHLVDSEEYLISVARYLVLNPVRAKLVVRAAQWPWSSYRATAGMTSAPDWLTTDDVLRRFHPTDAAIAREDYREYVAAPEAGSPWDHLRGQIYLGSEEFIERTQERIDESPRSREFPRAQRAIPQAGIDDVRGAIVTLTGEDPVRTAARQIRIAYAELARSETLAPLHVIGESLGVGATGVRFLLRRSVELRKTDERFGRLVETARLQIRNCRLKT